ncbi:PAS domain S-box protein [Geobacter anodireducens]|uniref:histidine kinase n=1 Tax=Geobacter soli TaxID=1510391 RepID=A0A0C1QR07_9BACT|nr:PAS domain S-box protein [Geobacter soli]KIE43192.1 histidine kinase [Geobacter soli]
MSTENPSRDIADLNTLTAVVECMPAPALLIKDERVFCNRATEALTGYRRDELSSLDTWFHTLFGSEHERARTRFDADRATGFPVVRREIITRKDGSRRLVEVAGSICGQLMCILHDITDLMDVRLQLQEHAERYRIIKSTSMDGFWVVDLHGSIVEANDACCHILGYSREELLTMSLHDIDATESAEETQKHIRNIVEQGSERFEVRHRRKDGTVIDVEVSTTFQPASRCFHAFIRDISERKQTEEALRKNEERFRLAMEATTDGIWDWNIAADSGYFSPAYYRILGYEPEDFSPSFQVWMELLHPEDRERAISTNMDCVEGRTQGFQAEFRMKAKDGSWRWILGRGSAVNRDSRGKALRLIGTHQDITERKQTEETIGKLNRELDRRVMERTVQLEEAIREQESFSYSVSHDLRAPLRHINSYSNLVIEDYGDQIPVEARYYLERICTASGKMGQLIDDLLELSRVGRVELRKGTVNLSKNAASAASMLQETEPYRAVDWVIAGDLTAQADRTLIRQVLLNLMGNALKYTARTPRARIEVGSTAADGETIFFVRDNGAGFDMAYGNKLFRPFQRLHGGEFPGTGIGLATVQRIIKRHGGRVWAEGEVNGGATFYFTLPED